MRQQENAGDSTNSGKLFGTPERNGNIDKLFSWEVGGARLKRDTRKVSDSQRNKCYGEMECRCEYIF